MFRQPSHACLQQAGTSSRHAARYAGQFFLRPCAAHTRGKHPYRCQRRLIGKMFHISAAPAPLRGADHSSKKHPDRRHGWWIGRMFQVCSEPRASGAAANRARREPGQERRTVRGHFLRVTPPATRAMPGNAGQFRAILGRQAVTGRLVLVVRPLRVHGEQNGQKIRDS